MKFELGKCLATPGALNLMEREGMSFAELLGRHVSGDWGTLDREDIAANNAALRHGARIFSSYVLPSGAKVWCITEADRSTTTLLLPSEY